jgi:hypothetical protein
VTNPIDDEDFLLFVLEPKLLGGHGHRIEEAESHRLLRLRVVTGWTDHGESIFNFSSRSCNFYKEKK